MNQTLPIVAFALGVTACGMLSCKQKESSPAGELKEAVKDGLDQRPNEKLKDAGEDAKDAVKEAAKDAKDAVRDATD